MLHDKLAPVSIVLLAYTVLLSSYFLYKHSQPLSCITNVTELAFAGGVMPH